MRRGDGARGQPRRPQGAARLTDPAHSTSDIFERPIGAIPTELLPNLWGLEIDAATESARYVREVKDRVRDLFGYAILK